MPALLSLSPYLVCRNAASALAFYQAAFGAEEIFRMTDPADGRIGHAELRIAGALVMIADEYPDFGAISPDTLGGTAVTLHLATEDADAATARAEAAGALVLRPPATQSFGERSAVLLDPYGHRWMLSQNVEALTPEEMQRRWSEQGA
ncbi:VOC family protein [Pararhodobacter aggregans]|uniref:Glyxoylase n=1 Tax=Pararhodobacter aggregans TaxID=404875 RepID=A0A2T7UTW1_9RHOB|nr:VOC family protein [Pararhodobacter aggregans]PTX02785.1 PhnB protein [Pararhodobacter aggregans]PVE48011.1 glyxoylase [Pararhodobacter aggregans]